MVLNMTLAEVALPLDAINKASAREKSIRHGQSFATAKLDGAAGFVVFCAA